MKLFQQNIQTIISKAHNYYIFYTFSKFISKRSETNQHKEVEELFNLKLTLIYCHD